MILSIIVAMTEDRVIGKENQLPWHISEDLKRFKSITMGHPIVMGRKTYESIGKPLPGRHNLVLSRNRRRTIKGTTVVSSLEAVLRMFEQEGRGKEEIFVIGGSSVFQEAYPKADRIYLTMIRHKFEGDTFFPEFELEKDFEIVEKQDRKASENGGFKYSFITAVRKKN